MRFAVGTVVHVRNMSDGSHVLARVDGVSRYIEEDRLDPTGKLVLVPKGYYYQVSYDRHISVSNVHERRLTPALR